MSEVTAEATAPEQITPELPKDLEAQVQTIRAFAQTHNMLGTGQYPYGYFKAVADCVQFIKILHERAIEVALEHPNADLVPELADLKKSKQSEVQANG